jgi:predicted DNA binding CopG/RHH family protein
MKSAHLPQTDSIEELARFWDSHDLTEIEDELVEVVAPVFERAEGTVTLRLPSEQVEAVQSLARERGVEVSALLAEWVRERLQAA